MLGNNTLPILSRIPSSCAENVPTKYSLMLLYAVVQYWNSPVAESEDKYFYSSYW